MTSFDTVLDAAQNLPTDDRLRLIEALWDSVPPDVDVPLHADWGPELEKRVAEIESGAASGVPWCIIRNEAFARIGLGKGKERRSGTNLRQSIPRLDLFAEFIADLIGVKSVSIGGS